MRYLVENDGIKDTCSGNLLLNKLKLPSCNFVSSGNSYMRDPWNWLDFSVVVVSLMAYIPGVSGLSVLRTFRVLRPLRALTTVPGMRVIISSLITSLHGVIFVLALSFCFFFVYAIVGVELWSGLFDSRWYVCRTLNSSRSQS